MRIQSIIRNGGLKSLLTKQEIDEIQKSINEVNNNNLFNHLDTKKGAFKSFIKNQIDTINENFKVKYGVKDDLLNSNMLTVQAQPRSGQTLIDKSVNRFLNVNTSALLKQVNKNIDEGKKTINCL
jgi:hypothetical protein